MSRLKVQLIQTNQNGKQWRWCFNTNPMWDIRTTKKIWRWYIKKKHHWPKVQESISWSCTHQAALIQSSIITTECTWRKPILYPFTWTRVGMWNMILWIVQTTRRSKQNIRLSKVTLTKNARCATKSTQTSCCAQVDN